MRFLYPQWNIATSDTSAALITAHYQQIADRLGYAVQPPLGMVQDWGSRFLTTQGQIGEAIELFRMNARNFPDVVEVHCTLGDTYARQGDDVQALACYETALALRRDDAQIQAKVQALRHKR